MDIQDKTKEELIIELQELKQTHNSLKLSLETNLFEHKQVEEALRRSEDNLFITLHSIGDGVISTDQDGLVVQMNPMAEKLCGYKFIEAAGKPLAEVFNIVNAETREAVADPVKKVLESGEIVGLANHTVLISKNGNEYQIADSAAPIKNKENTTIGVVLVFSDITENYIAQKQLKDNEERYHSLLNNLEAGIVVHAPDTSILMNNHRASVLLGLSNNQMKGKVAIDSAWKFVNEENILLPPEAYPVNQIVTGKKPIKNQVIGIRQPDKKDIVWVTVNGFPVLNNTGNITEIVVSFIDITKQIQTEKDLQQSERELLRQNGLFDSLINNLPIGVFMVDAISGKPIVANEAALKLLGRVVLPDATRDNLAEIYQAFKNDTDHPYPIDEMPIIKGTKGEFSYIDDMLLFRPDGSKTQLEISGSPVKDDKGDIWASLVSFTDITERKQTQQVLQESRNMLNEAQKLAHLGVWEWDKKTDKIIWSNQLYQMAGFNPELPAPVYSELPTIFTPKSWHLLRTAIDHTMKTDDEYQLELDLIRPDGSIRNVKAFGGRKVDDMGHITRLFGTLQDITEHKLSESIFKDIIEKNPMAIQILNMEGYTIETNSAHLKLFGVRPPADYSIFKDAQLIQQGLGELFEQIKKGEVVYFPDSHFNVNDVDPSFPDSPVWVKAIGFTLNNNNGIPDRIVIMHENITERKHAEALLNDIIEKNPMSIQIVDKEGYTLLGNPTYTKLFGAIPPSDFSIFADLQHKSKELEQLIKLAKSGEVVHLPVMYFNPHDEVSEAPDISLWIRALIFPLNDRGGKPERFVFIHENITEKKLAEDELKKSEERFNLAMKASNDGLFDWNLETNEIYFSPGWKKMLGYEDHELPNDFSVWEKTTEPEDIKKSWKLKQKLILKQIDRIVLELKMKHKEGHRVDILLRAEAIFNVNGKATRIVGTHTDITQRKQAEKEIRKIGQHYQALIEKAPDGVALINAEGNFKYISPSAKKMFGYNQMDEVFGNPAEYTHPEDLQLVLTELGKIFEDPAYVPTLEYRFIDKQGRWHWVETTFRNLLANSSVESIVLNFRDITERKQLEDVQNFLVTCGYPGSDENFFESLAKYLSETLNSEYVCIDKLEGDRLTAQTIAIYNEGKFDANVSYTLKQTPCGEVIGKTICYFPENVCLLFPHDEALQNLKAQSYIGTTLWSFDGKPIGLIAIIGQKPMNNTAFAENVLKMVAIRAAGELERKQVEDELRSAKEKAEDSEVKYRQIFDNTFDIMAIYEVTEDRRFKVITFNAAEAKLIGPIEYYQNRYIDDCIPPELYNEFKQHYEHCIEEEKLIVYEEDVAFQDIRKTFHTQLIPLKNSAGRIHRIIVISRDITDNKLLQNQMINQNEKLKLLNLDLIISKEKAEESDRLKSAFLANMSHEIRTPMNGILGFSDLLKDPELTGDQQQEYIRIIEKSGARMLNIINDIIDISKIESGQMKISVSETNINEQMEFIYKFFKTEIEQKGLQLTLIKQLTSSEAIIKTDREKLYSILTNLIKNAIKYTKEGSIDFGCNIIETRHDLSLHFYVKDSGIGIAKDRQEAIFERFIQADISDKMARQGAGLGLAISKAYVEMLGGKIWVESESGQGSTFYFTIPFQAKGKEENWEKDKILIPAKDSQIKKLKILIAEDDEASSQLLSLALRKFENEITKVKTGREAVDACRNNSEIDMILMDIQMPELDGYEATLQIREFNQEVVIIAQTAYALAGDWERAMEAGCTDYISKPIEREKFWELIQKYIKK